MTDLEAALQRIVKTLATEYLDAKRRAHDADQELTALRCLAAATAHCDDGTASDDERRLVESAGRFDPLMVADHADLIGHAIRDEVDAHRDIDCAAQLLSQTYRHASARDRDLIRGWLPAAVLTVARGGDCS